MVTPLAWLLHSLWSSQGMHYDHIAIRQMGERLVSQDSMVVLSGFLEGGREVLTVAAVQTEDEARDRG